MAHKTAAMQPSPSLAIRSAGDVIFTYEFAPADAKDGMQTNVFLSSAGGEAVLSAVGQHLEIDSLFILEAATKLDADLIKVITARGLLSVKVDRSVEQYPLEGAAEASADLIAACGP